MTPTWQDESGKIWMYGSGEVGKTMKWNGMDLKCILVDDTVLQQTIEAQTVPLPDTQSDPFVTQSST